MSGPGALPLLTVSYLGLGAPAVAAGILVVRGPGLIGVAEYCGAALIVRAVRALPALLRVEQKGSVHDHVCYRPEHRLR